MMTSCLRSNCMSPTTRLTLSPYYSKSKYVHHSSSPPGSMVYTPMTAVSGIGYSYETNAQKKTEGNELLLPNKSRDPYLNPELISTQSTLRRSIPSHHLFSRHALGNVVEHGGLPRYSNNANGKYYLGGRLSPISTKFSNERQEASTMSGMLRNTIHMGHTKSVQSAQTRYQETSRCLGQLGVLSPSHRSVGDFIIANVLDEMITKIVVKSKTAIGMGGCEFDFVENNYYWNKNRRA